MLDPSVNPTPAAQPAPPAADPKRPAPGRKSEIKTNIGNSARQ
jgi:hypothetical protein